ncbi:MAG TPA: M56 family metallopeptidase [Thermoanaerobaculia bacterium]|nr:M56 family metallopeptidase [Thermoanaerobaculia bacterium]
MSAVATHLWTSTFVLLAALLLARFLPLTARTRHALLLCGLVKFAIPSDVIASPLRALGVDRPAAAAVAVEWLAAPATVRTLSPRPSSVWPDALAVGWIVSAIALAAAWAIARRRLVTSLLRGAAPASPREHAALAAARRHLELHTSVDILRSTISEAPAVVRIIRPVVVLPDGGCDTLDDDELESLLRHECAHVARRDNLLGLFESAIVAAFWFHPLVWIAQRAIATTREEACDEVAAVSPDAVDTYVSALSKICSAVLTARLAGVSCMASAHLKERLNHIMKLETLRSRALSHGLVVSVAAIAVAAVTILGAVDAAALSDSKEPPYTLAFTARPGDVAGTIEFAGRVFDSATGIVLTRPHTIFKRGSSARVAAIAQDQEVIVDVREAGDRVTAVMRIAENAVPVQESTYTAALQPDGPRNTSGRRYTGMPMTLQLKDAELKNVLDTFSQLTGLKIVYADTWKGRVDVDVKNMPWDEALDVILRQNGLTWELEGDTLKVVPQ